MESTSLYSNMAPGIKNVLQNTKYVFEWLSKTNLTSATVVLVLVLWKIYGIALQLCFIVILRTNDKTCSHRFAATLMFSYHKLKYLALQLSLICMVLSIDKNIVFLLQLVLHNLQVITVVFYNNTF